MRHKQVKKEHSCTYLFTFANFVKLYLMPLYNYVFDCRAIFYMHLYFTVKGLGSAHSDVMRFVSVAIQVITMSNHVFF